MSTSDLRNDAIAGLTVALVAIPQCMAFAVIAGLEPAAGLHAAVVMGVVAGLLGSCPTLNIGPAVTTSSMVFAVLVTAAPQQPERWPALAGLLAVLVGLLTILGAILKAGQFVKFVSRTVLVGMTVGAALLIVGAQLGPALGVQTHRHATLIGLLWETLRRADTSDVRAALIAIGVMGLMLMGRRLGPRFPAPFVALALSGLVLWLCEAAGRPLQIAAIEAITLRAPGHPREWFPAPFGADLLLGAASLAIVGIIQTLAISKALADRAGRSIQPKRELYALGVANVAAGLLRGMPGAGSFARSALNEMAGAKTRAANLIAAVSLAVIVAIAAPLASYISEAALAGVLMVTAASIVDWKDFVQILRRDRHDRIVLAATILCVFFLPMHWAILIGLALSVALFLRRVSELHIMEMTRGENGRFHEIPLDDQTGTSDVTMLQIEGALFFAHAEDLAAALKRVFRKRPRVTIVRMRRTQQIDFSVVAAVDRVVRDYVAAGGQLIICGLTESLRKTLQSGPLGQTMGAGRLLRTTGEVFGSAHRALRLAETLLADAGAPQRRFRSAPPQRLEDEPETA